MAVCNRGEVLFACAAYHAVHLELVPELTATVFIMALRMFTSRRGRVEVLYSNNGTKSVGTDSLF